MMEIDELSYNVFYLLLRNEFRKKYDLALSKCWTICVPSGDSLRDISITKEFVDDHVLRPLPDSRFASTDESESHVYKIEKNRMKLVNDEIAQRDNYNIKILSIEKGYNKEYQPYNIIIVDKPIYRKYRVSAQHRESDKLQLNRAILTYKDAMDFLKRLPNNKSCPLDELTAEIEKIDMQQCGDIDQLKRDLQKSIRNCWANTMRKQSLDIQRDARFQKLLSISLEMFVMHRKHDAVYSMLSNLFAEQDAMIKKKLDELIAVEISPDQLGVKESSIVSTPSAMVELATLGSQIGPHDKLMCLKGTLDFIVAEVKGAIADVKSRTDFLNDSDDKHQVCALNTDDLIPLLLYVVIKCHCQKLVTDLYYMENFIWCIAPYDGLSYTIVTFKAALRLLAKIKVSDLPEKSSQVETKLKLDLLRKVEDAKDEPLHALADILEEGWPQLVF